VSLGQPPIAGPGQAVEPPRAAGPSGEPLLLALTFAAGVVDAVSYLGLGKIFTANMTGNLVFLALAVGQRNLLTALYSVGALIGFCCGALAAGRVLGYVRQPGAWPRRVTFVIAAELACMTAFAVGWVSLGGIPTGSWLYVLIGLSSFGMGMQNAAARYLAVPGLTTTVFTMALTGFMVDLSALRLRGPTQRRAVLAVVALFCGAAIGAALLMVDRVTPPVLTIITLLGVVVTASVTFGFRSNPSS
jgi:uncharacterized membrane protein YoaK (UPF0700 family)